MLVSDHPIAGRPDARLPWAPAWETLAFRFQDAMAVGWPRPLGEHQLRRKLLNRVEIKKYHVRVTERGVLTLAARKRVAARGANRRRAPSPARPWPPPPYSRGS